MEHEVEKIPMTINRRMEQTTKEVFGLNMDRFHQVNAEIVSKAVLNFSLGKKELVVESLLLHCKSFKTEQERQLAFYIVGNLAASGDLLGIIEEVRDNSGVKIILENECKIYDWCLQRSITTWNETDEEINSVS